MVGFPHPHGHYMDGRGINTAMQDVRDLDVVCPLLPRDGPSRIVDGNLDRGVARGGQGRVILEPGSHYVRASISDLTDQKSLGQLLQLGSVVTSPRLRHSGRSAMSTKNRIGPRIDPSPTPNLTLAKPDLVPFQSTHC
jgi:hypothetical protein